MDYNFFSRITKICKLIQIEMNYEVPALGKKEKSQENKVQNLISIPLSICAYT
jgi:hypothetical protein